MKKYLILFILVFALSGHLLAQTLTGSLKNTIQDWLQRYQSDAAQKQELIARYIALNADQAYAYSVLQAYNSLIATAQNADLNASLTSVNGL